MNIARTLAAAAATLLLTQAVFAAPHTPPKGSVERTTLLNTLRRSLGNGRRKAIITPDHFKVENGWAYIAGAFQYADGSSPGMDYMGGSFSALLHREGQTWQVKRRVYNGDVVEPDFLSRFPQAPKAIFKRQ